MRDRLIELIVNADTYDSYACKLCTKDDDACDCCYAEKLADHLLANGVVVLPCKVGDRVYHLNRVVWDNECCRCDHYRVGGFGDPSECGRTEDGMKHPDCIEITEGVLTQDSIYHYLRFHAFGESVFPSREEAEQALEDMRKE